ncbi:MAG: hypothetical protein AB1331_00250 [Bacillota bacterium]
MTLTIVPLTEEHLDQVAELFVAGYRAQRQAVPSLPNGFEDAESIHEKPSRLSRRAPGAVAMEDRRLVGFFLGVRVDSLLGGRGVYVPEWGHAVAGGRAL